MTGEGWPGRVRMSEVHLEPVGRYRAARSLAQDQGTELQNLKEQHKRQRLDLETSQLDALELLREKQRRLLEKADGKAAFARQSWELVTADCEQLTAPDSDPEDEDEDEDEAELAPPAASATEPPDELPDWL